MRLVELAIGTLGVWRVTHLLYAEHGPWKLIERFRRLLGDGFWASLIGCFYCLSLWVAIPFTLLLTAGVKQRLLLWPALSGAAILLERLTAREIAEAPELSAQPAVYVEDEEIPDVLMQQDSGRPSHDASADDGALHWQ